MVAKSRAVVTVSVSLNASAYRSGSVTTVRFKMVGFNYVEERDQHGMVDILITFGPGHGLTYVTVPRTRSTVLALRA